VTFKHEYITQPTITPHDVLIKAITELTTTINGKTDIKELEQFEAVRKLEDLVKNSPCEKVVKFAPNTAINTRNAKTNKATKRYESSKTR
jgi:hypothetical protein